MNNFSFSRLPELYFGVGSVNNLGNLSLQLGNNALLITGGSSYLKSGISKAVEKSLAASGISWERFPISGEPSPRMVDQIAKVGRQGDYTLVIAIGGGSVLDAGKAVASMVKEEGSVKEYLEGVGTHTPSGKRLGLIAVPTTSGTGSEATKNAVISELGAEGYKKSLRHDKFVPDYAIIDPELTMHCPQNITASSGMDAFTQLLESYLSPKSNAFTEALAYSGLERISNSLQKAFEDGNDLDARSDVAYAAYLSGICLANAGLGVVHGFAQPLGSLFPVPHGVVCGRLMGAVNQISIEKLKRIDPSSTALQRYANVGKLFKADGTLSDDHAIDYILNYIHSMTEKLKIPRLGEYDIKENNFSKIVSLTGIKDHPVDLDDGELRTILKDSL